MFPHWWDLWYPLSQTPARWSCGGTAGKASMSPDLRSTLRVGTSGAEGGRALRDRDEPYSGARCHDSAPPPQLQSALKKPLSGVLCHKASLSCCQRLEFDIRHSHVSSLRVHFSTLQSIYNPSITYAIEYMTTEMVASRRESQDQFRPMSICEPGLYCTRITPCEWVTFCFVHSDS